MLVGYAIIALCTCISLGVLILVLWDLFSKGSSSISWSFLTEYPKKGMTQGGIFPAIIGTFSVTMVCAIFSIPLSIAAAVYLNEYASQNWRTKLIRSSIRNLAGVPSIVYGLFGLAIFVQAMNFGTSILASGMTLGLMSLPYMITASEEALKSVPGHIKDGAYALGATKWETIRSILLPMSAPGIVTGIILALSRAAGETAPILFTGVFFYQKFLPSSVWDEFMALPYHLFILSTQHHDIIGVRGLAYGTALVLLALVLGLNLIAFYVRSHYQKKLLE
jgi:phosphate transport system permease protein